MTGREGVHFKSNGEIELEAKALGRSCFKVGDEGQILKVKVADQYVSLLVDTGSQVSVLTPQAYDGLPERDKDLEKAKVLLKAVNGSPFPVKGSVTLPLEVGSSTSKERFLIADIGQSFEVDGILGVDILRAHRGQIDLENERVRYDGTWISCVSTSSEVVAASDITIEPRHVSFIKVALPTGGYGTGETKVGLVQPDVNFQYQSGLLVAMGVVDTTKAVATLKALNCSDEAIHVSRGQTVAMLEPLEEDNFIKVVCGATHSAAEETGGLPEYLQDIFTRSCRWLNSEQSEKLEGLLIKYQTVFAVNDEDLGRTNLVKHTINVGTAKPIKQAPRRQPMAKRQLEEAEVEKMLRQGVISPSSSPWASPTVLITKKDGKTRFCVDYRELNQVTIKDAYPLPRVEDCIDNLEGAQWFCTMDVQSGFWQVELDPKDKEKTSFCTRLGLYQFNVLPFGLTNAPATFERLMETVLRGLQWYECLLFFDDIVVFGLAFEITLARLEHVFQRLMDAGLKLKPKKCVLFQKEVEFLGHIVGADGVKTQPDKTECVRNWPTPKNRKEVRSFLGLAGYYRRLRILQALQDR